MTDKADPGTPMVDNQIATITAALDYASRGMPVFPCHPVEKRPLTPHGFKDATTKKSTIIAWWNRRPDAMIGMPTGMAIGAFVLDINPPEGRSMDWALDTLRLNCGMGVVDTQKTVTPKGLHLWYECNTPVRCRGPLLEGAIDCVRGDGGYVIVPPSVNQESGRQYVWDDSHAMVTPPVEFLMLLD